MQEGGLNHIDVDLKKRVHVIPASLAATATNSLVCRFGKVVTVGQQLLTREEHANVTKIIMAELYDEFTAALST